MSNSVERWFSNAIDAGYNVHRAAERNKSADAAKKTLANKDEAKKLTPNQKAQLREVAKSKPKAEESVKDARGQFLGALLQNRKYDSKGQIVGTQKGHTVTKVNRKTGRSE